MNSTDVPTRRPKSELGAIVAEHAIRGAALHVWLRAALVAFAITAVFWAPPDRYAPACQALAIGYGLWAVGIAFWFRRDPDHLVRSTWLLLTVDLLLFGVLNQFAGISAQFSWTPYILVNGFLIVPVLAAAQLRVGLATAVGVVTSVLYLISSIAAQQANGGTGGTYGEPWSSVVLRTVVVIAVSLGAVLLTRLQRGRVADIARLAGQRAELLRQLGELGIRQRREFAEALHDGALQYLLGARLELEDARETGDQAAFDRVDEALTTSAGLLRSLVTELHPAVLAQSGLAQALEDLVSNLAGRTKLDIRLGIDPPGDEERNPNDLLLYSAVRELLGNVVKHARAHVVSVDFSRGEAAVRIDVADDGIGIADGVRERQLAAGHIGVASQVLRIEAAGGTLTFAPRDGGGTVAVVRLPVP